MGKLASQPVPRVAEPQEHFVHLPTRLWKSLLVVGAVTWFVAAAITQITKDNVLVPTVIIVGSFMVPVAVAAFALSRRRAGYLTTEEVVLGFFAAGTLAVATTALLETYLLPSAAGTFIAVGTIEEIGKGAVLLAVAHQVHHREARDGIVLGAIVGSGFAAFESAGYALQAMLANLDHRTVVSILETEATRAALAPFGHITWTALLGGALFASSSGGRFHVTRRLVLTLLGVITLHALWDQTYGWAVMLTNGLVTGDGWDLLWPNAQFWPASPTAEAAFWFNVFYTALLVVNSLVGVAWLVASWRRYGTGASVRSSSARSG